MAKFDLRLKARELRRSGFSLGVIATKLRVSKGTVGLWCRDIVLSEDQIKSLYRRNGCFAGALANRKKKENIINSYLKDGERDVGVISHKEFFIAGIALYWAEGSKKSKFHIANSDLELIYFMFKWFKDIFGVKKEEFMPRLFVNSIHKYRVQVILQF